MRCDGSPDPSNQGEINTFLSLWREQSAEPATPDESIRQVILALNLINELETLCEDLEIQEDLADREKQIEQHRLVRSIFFYVRNDKVKEKGVRGKFINALTFRLFSTAFDQFFFLLNAFRQLASLRRLSRSRFSKSRTHFCWAPPTRSTQRPSTLTTLTATNFSSFASGLTSATIRE